MQHIMRAHRLADQQAMQRGKHGAYVSALPHTLCSAAAVHSLPAGQDFQVPFAAAARLSTNGAIDLNDILAQRASGLGMDPLQNVGIQTFALGQCTERQEIKSCCRLFCPLCALMCDYTVAHGVGPQGMKMIRRRNQPEIGRSAASVSNYVVTPVKKTRNGYPALPTRCTH